MYDIRFPPTAPGTVTTNTTNVLTEADFTLPSADLIDAVEVASDMPPSRPMTPEEYAYWCDVDDSEME